MAFVPLGHLVSRLMFSQKKLPSYSFNLLGSIAGILVFALMSLYWTGPSLWFLFGFIILIFFQKKDYLNILFSSISLFILLLIFLIPREFNKEDIYSPYQIISVTYKGETISEVKASNLFFQTPLELNSMDPYYFLPYKATNIIPKKILIVGSGTGNDTAAAIQAGVDSVDAVEIDPVIIELGKYHPNKPYENKKVNVIKNDARNFIRHTNEKYDLIVYGLLDSHTSLSSNGGIRLDSYVYTVQAFEEAKNKLKKNGYISLSFSVLSKDLGVKIFKMLKKAFNNQNPVVYVHVPGSNAPELDDAFFIDGEVYKGDWVEGKYTVLISNNSSKVFKINDQKNSA